MRLYKGQKCGMDKFEQDLISGGKSLSFIPSVEEQHKERSVILSVKAILSCSREAEEPGSYILFY